MSTHFYFFYSIFETSQSLFWAGFGLVDLTAFDLTGIKSFTRFWGLLLFGSYSVINIIVLLNMLIAMMSNSYQIISVSLHIIILLTSMLFSNVSFFFIFIVYRNDLTWNGSLREVHCGYHTLRMETRYHHLSTYSLH